MALLRGIGVDEGSREHRVPGPSMVLAEGALQAADCREAAGSSICPESWAQKVTPNIKGVSMTSVLPEPALVWVGRLGYGLSHPH